ncbi:hypothetical protein Vretimale_13340 [Volvox reticuliferus]|uniref:Uncharacterized protein n=1 Tax=Volvox reticuliferus TaxID=1737510 RepID=A0A8J4GL31_9CHLO|nr:hypothetical protein Vretimale_13340 [Volvox reticuliferus]
MPDQSLRRATGTAANWALLSIPLTFSSPDASPSVWLGNPVATAEAASVAPVGLSEERPRKNVRERNTRLCMGVPEPPSLRPRSAGGTPAPSPLLPLGPRSLRMDRRNDRTGPPTTGAGVGDDTGSAGGSAAAAAIPAEEACKPRAILTGAERRRKLGIEPILLPSTLRVPSSPSPSPLPP